MQSIDTGLPFILQLLLNKTTVISYYNKKEHLILLATNCEVYWAVVGLHALVSAVDILVNCSLESAISYLKTVQAHQQHLLGGNVFKLE